MSTGEVFARIAQMRDAAATINKSADRIREAVESAEREIRAIGPERFMSAGAEAFRAEYQRLTPELRESYNQLLQFSERLRASADDIELAARTGR